MLRFVHTELYLRKVWCIQPQVYSRSALSEFGLVTFRPAVYTLHMINSQAYPISGLSALRSFPMQAFPRAGHYTQA